MVNEERTWTEGKEEMIGQRKKFWNQIRNPKVKRKFILLIILVVLYGVNLFFFTWYVSGCRNEKGNTENEYTYVLI